MNKIKTVKTTNGGIDYLTATLNEGKTVFTSTCLWAIPHNTKDHELSLKIGRYKKHNNQIVDCSNPKSELTLSSIEFSNLISFLEENYEPLSIGAKRFISFDGELSEKFSELIKSNANARIINVLADEKILPDELYLGLQNAKRVKAIEEFERLLESNVTESIWQEWFEYNPWILGSEFVQILDDRRIDTSNIADYLVKAYDGFLDIIEIKRPSPDLQFWSNSRDHENYIPSQSLVKAISQSQKYIYEVERESNSAKFIERCDGIIALKPRCYLIYGRSNDWNKGQREALRLLNASYNNINILTYDQVLVKAKNMLGLV